MIVTSAFIFICLFNSIDIISYNFLTAGFIELKLLYDEFAMDLNLYQHSTYTKFMCSDRTSTLRGWKTDALIWIV